MLLRLTQDEPWRRHSGERAGRWPTWVARPGHNLTIAAWVGRTATEIAAAPSVSGDVTARGVVAEHLCRIAKVNAELGAFVRVRSAEALREAGEIDARADRGDLRLAGVRWRSKIICRSAGSRCGRAARRCRRPGRIRIIPWWLVFSPPVPSWWGIRTCRSGGSTRLRTVPSGSPVIHGTGAVRRAGRRAGRRGVGGGGLGDGPGRAGQ